MTVSCAIMLRAIMPNYTFLMVMLGVVMLSVVMLSVVMLSVVMLSAVLLSVVAPQAKHQLSDFVIWLILSVGTQLKLEKTIIKHFMI